MDGVAVHVLSLMFARLIQFHTLLRYCSGGQMLVTRRSGESLAGLSNNVEYPDNVLQSLVLGLQSGLEHHVDQLLVVRFAGVYHLTELGTQPVEGDTLLVTSALAVLCNHL